MKAGIQTMMQEAGESACYALDIIEIAERIRKSSINPIQALYKAFDLGYIYYNAQDPNDNNNFFVKNPAAFLSDMTSQKWEVEKVPAAYMDKDGEYVVDYWERQATGKTIGHFRLHDWDPLMSSLTVRYGKLVSRRVFRRVG
jgi:hypothetical protein